MEIKKRVGQEDQNIANKQENRNRFYRDKIFENYKTKLQNL